MFKFLFFQLRILFWFFYRRNIGIDFQNGKFSRLLFLTLTAMLKFLFSNIEIWIDFRNGKSKFWFVRTICLISSSNVASYSYFCNWKFYFLLSIFKIRKIRISQSRIRFLKWSEFSIFGAICLIIFRGVASILIFPIENSIFNAFPYHRNIHF